VGDSSTQGKFAESCSLTARIYHAHAKCTYGTPTEEREQAIIRKTFPQHEIVDPGLEEDNEEKLFGGMDYCLKLVKSCDALAFSRINGEVTSGVGKEVEYALSLGTPVYELAGDSMSQVLAPPKYLSIEETVTLYDEWENENL